ncbi:Accessory gene regulator protein B [bioreactor metagenome]|uniref:Accessory gene regulator protein B n=2 Tax=root TaxID=1 RepID=A0A645A965_9ZZZZ
MHLVLKKLPLVLCLWTFYFILLYLNQVMSMIIDALAKRIEDFIVAHMEEVDSIKIETIRYGIKVFLINAYKIPIIFITAYLLGIFKYAVIAYICFGSLRTFAGGIHAERGIACIISSMIILYSPAYLSPYLDRNYNIALFIITFIIIALYSPSDTRKKPIKSYKLKADLKADSILIVVIIFAASCLLPKDISGVMVVSMFFESLLVLPITYKIFGKERSSYA